jgi:threonine dehydratase
VSAVPPRADVLAAQARIASYVRRTPVLQIELPGVAAAVTLKLEQLQHTGSFKVRGVFNTLLTHDIPAAGVTTASGGNHGAAMAYAASRLGHPCTVFVPSIAPAGKIKLIERFGASVHVVGDVFAEAAEAAADHSARTGALDVHPYNGASVITGQGTVAAELHAQTPDLDTVLASVGGGGFIGGLATYYGDDVRLVGVEPDQSPTLHAARVAGHPVDVKTGGIAADSLGCRRIGDLAYGLASRHVDDVVLVTDEDIRQAQHWLWSECRLIAEAGGATALAALLSGRIPTSADQHIGVVVCGANTDPTTWGE